MDTTVTYIDRHDSLRPVGPQATQSLLDEKKIPTLQEHEYQQWAEYLFSAPLPLRLQVSETVLRHDRRHPYAPSLFLACNEPSAAFLSHRWAHKFFLHPSDLTLELMYDAAMNTLMTLPQQDFVLADTSFPVFLFVVIKNGVLRAVVRMKDIQVEDFGSSSHHPRQPRLDEQLNAKQMLDKIADLQPSPQTPAYLNRFLHCLVRLGPDNALTPSTNTQNLKRRLKRNCKPQLMLDLEPVMKELGISHRSAITYLSEVRKILTQKFNPDGTLFLAKSKPASERR